MHAAERVVDFARRRDLSPAFVQIMAGVSVAQRSDENEPREVAARRIQAARNVALKTPRYVHAFFISVSAAAGKSVS